VYYIVVLLLHMNDQLTGVFRSTVNIDCTKSVSKSLKEKGSLNQSIFLHGQYGFFSSPYSFKKKCSDDLIRCLKPRRILRLNENAGNLSENNNFNNDSWPYQRNNSCLFCLRLNSNGNLLAASSGDVVQIWSVFSGKLLFSLKDHSEIITSLVWFHENNSEGMQMADNTNELHSFNTLEDSGNGFFTSSLDMTIRYWRNYSVMATYTEHNDWIRCLDLTSDNCNLLSGCVSSVIFGWDIHTGKPVFRIPQAHQSQSYPELNSINSLHYSHNDRNLFSSAARDGSIKLWDSRCVPKSVLQIFAHKNKANNAMFSFSDQQLLTSGRDSSIRLWDLRTLSSDSSESVPSKKFEIGTTYGLLNEYSKHVCTGYNVSSMFFNNEKNIVTGSEDNQIFIYDKNSGNVINTLSAHESITHLLDCNDNIPLQLFSSSLENNEILVWEPTSSSCNSNENYEEKEGKPSSSKIAQRVALESFMRKHGDRILRIFHKVNFTYNSSFNWGSLINSNGPDDEGDDMLQLMHEMLDEVHKALSTTQQSSELHSNLAALWEEEEELADKDPLDQDLNDYK